MCFRSFNFVSLSALLCCLVACTEPQPIAVDLRGNEPDPYVVQSYPMDSKQYRYVELDNGMRTLLVSDPDTVQAMASLSVAVGSYQDPEDWQGLAHFLEHMLFLGTEKYPDASEYLRYLDAHGGQRNAYTSYDLTNYHFSIDANALEGALDRFSQFFIAPLFTEKYVEREKNAVHSEYFTRINNDGIRWAEAFENVINPDHPAFKFNAGNLDTLSDKPDQKARDVLIDFYETYYSADQMTLALISNHPLDELEKLARDKFSTIPVLAKVPEVEFPALFEEGDLPKIIEVKPVQEQRVLSLIFPLPVMTQYHRENPLGFVAGLIGAEGENSLRDRLKERGWVITLGASAGMHYGGNDSFSITVLLTEEGVKHQDQIIAALFDQITLVKESGVQEWRYNETKNLAEVGFRFAESSAFGIQETIGFANALQKTLPRDLIGAGFKRFDEALINRVLDHLRPDNMIVSLTAPDVKPDSTTKFYGAEYRTYRPSTERVASWSKSQYADLTLPERNPLIPENFNLEPVVSAQKPLLLSDSGAVELWHYPNIENGVPGATIMLAIDRPDRPTLEQTFIEQFYFSLMSEQLQDLSYNTQRAGMTYAVSTGGVTFAGYSDKLSQLSDLVLKQILKPQFTQQQFDRLMDNMERNIRNYNKVAPTQGVGRELQQLLNADSYSLQQQIAAIEKITLEKVLAAPKWLYGEARMQMLAAGNITDTQARDFAARIVSTLGVTGTDRKIPQGIRVVRVDEGKQPHDVLVTELEHQDAAVLRYYQGRDSSQRENIIFTFLGQMINQYYFNSLRTEQQLGYIVQAGVSQMDRTPGLAFVVQSPTADANRVEAATNQFLPLFKQVMADMTAADFQRLKQAMLAQLNKKPQNLAEKISLFWQDLRFGYRQFNSREQAIAAVEAVTLQDIRDAYQAVILDRPRSVSVIAPGAKGGVKGSIQGIVSYRQDKELIVRQ